ncbi:hypothetical protein EAF04_004476 [Stromatinia cepivora]|nr:hypothetical protein EAF04_004476 [Stromatinia cepivora]
MCFEDGTLGYLMRDKVTDPEPDSPLYINAKVNNRAVMTLCDTIFEDYIIEGTNQVTPKKLTDIPVTADLGGVDIEYLSTMVSLTMIHETRQWVWMGKHHAMSSENNKENADSCKKVRLALWGGLAERGYTLPRRLNAKGSVDGVNQMRAKEGIIALYRDITK